MGKKLPFQETSSTAWLNFVSLAYFARLAQETVALFSIIFLDKRARSLLEKASSRAIICVLKQSSELKYIEKKRYRDKVSFIVFELISFALQISKTLLIMSRLLIYSLCTLFSISLSAQRKVHVVDATTRQPIENVVVTDAQSGKVLGITPKNGLFLSTSQTKKLSFSHLSYQPLSAPIADTIRLVPRDYNIAPTEVTAKAADYYRLRAVVRSYQYVDSIPVNFVDAVLDLYRVLKLDAYKDKARIRENNLNRSKVEVDDNGLLDWVSNHHVATNSPSFILQQSGEEKLILKKKTREPLGSLTFDPSQRAYVAKVNLLTPKDTATRHLFGRSIKFNLHTLEERFPASVDTARLRVYDLQSYRWLLQRDTWTNKYPTRVPLTAIHEIVVFERQRLSKADYKKLDFDTDWYDIPHSLRGRAATENIDLSKYTLPLPQDIQSLLGNQLQLLPYKD